MKKLLFLIAITFLSLNVAAQQTSQQILDDIKHKIGSSFVMIMKTDTINKTIIYTEASKLIDKYNYARLQEVRSNPDKDVFANNSINGDGGPFCFLCYCVCGGHIITQGDCNYFWYSCNGVCPTCGCGSWNIYATLCQGSPCGNIIGELGMVEIKTDSLISKN